MGQTFPVQASRPLARLAAALYIGRRRSALLDRS